MLARVLAVLAAAALVLIGAAPSSAILIYGIDVDDNLFSFDSEAPEDILTGVFVKGLESNETLLGIDFRVADLKLYALGSYDNLYTLDTTTGQATLVGSGIGAVLSGSSFGFDVNPRADRLRIVSNTDQNLRLNMDTGLLANTDPTVAYILGDVNVGQNPSLVGAAYTNNVSGGVGTRLYVIDSVRDVLAFQEPANDGALNTVGSLGADVLDMAGFDITGTDNLAFAAFLRSATDAGASDLFSINLASGQGTNRGRIGGGLFVRDIAIPIPEPDANLLLGLGLIGLGWMATRRPPTSRA